MDDKLNAAKLNVLKVMQQKCYGQNLGPAKPHAIMSLSVVSLY